MKSKQHPKIVNRTAIALAIFSAFGNANAQQAEVQKAHRAIRAAEEKLTLLKQWQRQFDHRVEAPARQLEKLRHVLGSDLGRAVAWLNDLIKTLAAYSEMSPAAASQTQVATPTVSDTPPETGEKSQT